MTAANGVRYGLSASIFTPRRERRVPRDARLRDRHRLRQRRAPPAPRRISRSAAGRTPATAIARPATPRSTRSPSGRPCTSTTAGASSAPRSTTSDRGRAGQGIRRRRRGAPAGRGRRCRCRRVGRRAAQDVRGARPRGRAAGGHEEPGPARDARGRRGRRHQLRRSSRARSSASSVRTAPARRRRSRCSPGCCTRRRARPACSATCRRGASATYLRRITLVMGNRNQLQWDLPALDSFELTARDLPHPAPATSARTRDELHRAARPRRRSSTSRCATCRSASG